MNINFSCRPSVLPFLVLFTHALSFPLSTVISALTLCPVFDAMRYYGNVMTTRWWLCVTMATLWQQQDGGYELLWQRYDKQQDGGYKLLWQRYDNKMVAMSYYGNVSFCCWRCVYWACYRCILHLQQYSHRLNLYFFCISSRTSLSNDLYSPVVWH